MTNIIDVVWLNKNPEAAKSGYWDQELLERLFKGDLWRPANIDIKFNPQFYSSTDQVTTGGAVVVIPGQHNYNYIEEINAELRLLDWCLVVITGDEEHLFHYWDLHHPYMRLWVQTPDPMVSEDAFDQGIGEPFTPKTRELLNELPPMHKKLDFFFAGQVTHARREQCVEALQDVPRGLIKKTPGFSQGFSAFDYFTHMSEARVVPCPSGPHTPDTFRVFEALEAGAVPLADATTPKGDGWGYWEVLYKDIPFPIVTNWSDAPQLIREINADWPLTANRCGAWYQSVLRETAHTFYQHLWEMSPMIEQSQRPEDLITVIITSSPIPSHPSTNCIERVVRSVKERLGDVEIIIACDGVRPEQEHWRANYEAYFNTLLEHCRRDWKNVLPVRFEQFLHQANTTRCVIDEYVRTPYILFMEHDTQLIGDIPFDDLLAALNSGDVNVIRLHSEASVLEPHKHLMLDTEPLDIQGAPLLRTVQWSQRPHLALTEWYSGMLNKNFGRESRTMIEDCIYGVLDEAWNLHGEEGWERFKLWMYAPPGDIKRSGHLDGRAGDEKFDMIYEYDGDIPEGAPYPTSKRTS